MLLRGAASQVRRVIVGRRIHHLLRHAHVRRIDHALLVHAGAVAGTRVHLLLRGRVHHGVGRVGDGARGAHLRGHGVSASVLHVSDLVVLHRLLWVDGAGDGAHLLLLRVVTRHYVDEKVEDVRLLDGRRDIGALQGAALGLLGLRPRAVGELEDEHLARLRKQHRRLCGDHAHVLVRLHDFLDARQGEEVVLEVVRVLYLLQLVHPEGLQLLVQLGQVVLLLDGGLTRLRRLLLHERGRRHVCVGRNVGGGGGRERHRGGGGVRGRTGGGGASVVGHGCGGREGDGGRRAMARGSSAMNAWATACEARWRRNRGFLLVRALCATTRRARSVLCVWLLYATGGACG